MKYVDNLLAVKPSEIKHITCDAEIQAIIKVEETRRADYAILVIFKTGSVFTYTVDGRYPSEGKQQFVFRTKKVLRLKPLHQVITEDNMEWSANGFVSMNRVPSDRPFIITSMFDSFGKDYHMDIERDGVGCIIDGLYFHQSWFTEEEEVNA
jgi:hypothetical protein